MRFVITSDCFDGKTHRKKGEVVSYDDEKVIGQMRAAGRLADVSSEDARRIETEVSEQTAREKRAKREPWTRAHKIALMAAILGLIYFVLSRVFEHRAAPQPATTPVAPPPSSGRP